MKNGYPPAYPKAYASMREPEILETASTLHFLQVGSLSTSRQAVVFAPHVA